MDNNLYSPNPKGDNNTSSEESVSLSEQRMNEQAQNAPPSQPSFGNTAPQGPGNAQQPFSNPSTMGSNPAGSNGSPPQQPFVQSNVPPVGRPPQQPPYQQGYPMNGMPPQQPYGQVPPPQQPPYGQPMNGMPPQQPYGQPMNNFQLYDNPTPAIISLIIGIVSLLFVWIIPFLGTIAPIVGIVLASKGMRSSKRGMAIGGLVTSIIALFFSIFVLIGFLMFGSLSYYYYY